MDAWLKEGDIVPDCGVMEVAECDMSETGQRKRGPVPEDLALRQGQREAHQDYGLQLRTFFEEVEEPRVKRVPLRAKTRAEEEINECEVS